MHVNQAGRPRSSAQSRGRQIALGALCALIAAAVYFNALINPFIYDDHRLVLENLSLRNLHDWRGLLWHDISRPLVNLSYAIDYALWGGANAFGFHLTNVLVHMANVALFFTVAGGVADDVAAGRRALQGRGDAPVLSALLFAAHPVLTQAVGYVSGRSDLFSTFFMLVAFLSARRAIRTGGWPWWCATLGAWVLALASKEVAVMFPFALLIYDRLCLPGTPEERRRRVRLVHVPLVTLAVTAGLVRLLVLTQIEHPSDSPIVWRFALVELDVFWQYLQLMVIPRRQTIFHAIAPIHSLFEVRALVGIAIAVWFGLAIRWLRKIDAAASFGAAWFALMLVPTAVLVVLDRGEPMAEHRVYAASAGLFLVMGRFADVALHRSAGQTRLRSWLAESAVLIMLLLLGAQTVMRNLVWHRPVTLWLEAAEYAPDHWLPRLGLGEALHQEGRHEEAVGMFKAAIALRPTETLAYAKEGQCEIELQHWNDATRTFTRLRALDPTSSAAAAGLAITAMRGADEAIARRYMSELIAKDPENVPWRQALAMIAEPMNPAEALRACEDIARLAPNTPGNDDCIRRNRARLERMR